MSQHNTTGSDVTSSNPYSPATYGARDVTSGGIVLRRNKGLTLTPGGTTTGSDVTSGGIVLRRNKGLTLTPGGTTTGSDVTIHAQAYKCLAVINTMVS